MNMIVKRVALAALIAVPSVGSAGVIDLASNNFDELNAQTNATWSSGSGDGVTMSLNSSAVVFWSALDAITTNDLTGNDSVMTFTFSQAVSAFSFKVQDIDYQRDGFSNFSVSPTSVTGDLWYYEPWDAVYANYANVDGYINWTNLNTTTISFDWVRDTNMGIGMLDFQYELAPSVPAPSAVLLMAAGLAGMTVGARRRKTAA